MTVKIGILLLLGAGLCLAQPASVCNVSNAQINNYVLTAVGTGKNCQWKPATGGATPGGSNTQVQFNDGGVFGANSGFTFDKSTGNVAIGTRVLGQSGDTYAAPIVAAVNAQTGTSYTLVSGDNGKVVTFNNASAITLTVPASLGAGFNCLIVQLGAGAVTPTASGTTLHQRQSYTKTAGQYAIATLAAYAADIFVLGGDLQ